MKRQQQALNTFNTIAAMSPKVNPISPTNFMVTPQQQANLRFEENQLNQQISQSAANAKAAASNNMFSNIIDTGFSLAGVLKGGRDGKETA